MDLMTRRRHIMMGSNPLIVMTATGNPAAFTAKVSKALTGLTIPFSPVQNTSNGEPSPTNICPITGWDGVQVTRTGANMFDGECESGYINVTTGQPDTNDNRYRTKNYISVFPDTTYYAKWSAHQTANNVVCRICYYDMNKDYISASGSVYTNGTFTTPSNAWFMKFFVNEAFSNYDNDISINYPATATTYEPYTSTTIPVDWTSEAGTVYGGTLDSLTGVLTVTHASVMLGNLNDWENNSSLNNGIMRATVNDIKVPSSTTTPTTAKMDRRKAKAWSPLYVNDTDYFGISSTKLVVIPMGHAVNSVEDFLSEYGEAQLCYPLDTPLTFQTEPVTLTTLKGNNVLWTDTNGMNTIKYLNRN